MNPISLFHLTLSCALPVLHASSPEGCARDALSCGESVVGSTAGLTADWLLRDGVPEALHALAAAAPSRVTLTTCSRWVSPCLYIDSIGFVPLESPFFRPSFYFSFKIMSVAK